MRAIPLAAMVFAHLDIEHNAVLVFTNSELNSKSLKAPTFIIVSQFANTHHRRSVRHALRVNHNVLFAMCYARTFPLAAMALNLLHIENNAASCL